VLVLGLFFLLGGLLGIATNLRMNTVRRNPIFTFGSVLFFIGPIVLGIRSLARSLQDVSLFALILAGIGLLLILAGLILGRRRSRAV
jgi:hypothetical protein